MSKPSFKTTFALRPGHPTLQELHRILLEQADLALFQLTTPELDPDKAVHEARKAFKRIRAVLRLVRDEIPKDTYRALNLLFRDAGRALSEVRTSAVLAETLEKLAQHALGQLSSEDVDAVLVRLRAYHEAQRVQAMGTRQLLLEVAGQVQEGRAQLRDLPLEAHRFPTKGLQRVYARGRRDLMTCEHHPTVEALHEWRKYVKYLRYHMRLFTPLWPQVLGCVTASLVDLSEWLGLDHDLAELDATLTVHPELGLPGPRQGMLRALIQTYRAELEADALRAGRRLYGERPKAFTHRMEAYWRAWNLDG